MRKGQVITPELKLKLSKIKRKRDSLGRFSGELFSFNCDNCHKNIRKTFYTYNQYKKHFCSNKCYGLFRSSLPLHSSPLFGTGQSKEINKEKLRANSIFNHYLEDKKIPRKPCVLCGKKLSWGHHYNYKLPLSVIWLCRKHHEYLHQLLKKAKGTKELKSEHIRLLDLATTNLL